MPDTSFLPRASAKIETPYGRWGIVHTGLPNSGLCSYTMGLSNLPFGTEISVMGVSQIDAQSLIISSVQYLLRGNPLIFDTPINGMDIQPNMDIPRFVFKLVTGASREKYFPFLLQEMDTKTALCQLVWSNQDGLFPWQTQDPCFAGQVVFGLQN